MFYFSNAAFCKRVKSEHTVVVSLRKIIIYNFYIRIVYFI